MIYVCLMHILGHNMAMARALEESEMDTFRHTERERETEMETKTRQHVKGGRGRFN